MTSARPAYKGFGVLALAISLIVVLGLGRQQVAHAFSSLSSPFTLTTGAAPAPTDQYMAGFDTLFTAGRYIGPTGMVFQPGKIYVADAAAHFPSAGPYGSLYVFPATGGSYPITSGTDRFVIPGCINPIGLTLGPDTKVGGGGGLYVACVGSGVIEEITRTGPIRVAVVRVLVDFNSTFPLSEPRDMTMNGTSILVTAKDPATSEYGVFRVTTGAVPTVTICASGPLFDVPDGLVINHQNQTIYVSNDGNDTLVQIPFMGGVCGAPSTFASFPSGTAPDGIAVGLNGACQNTLFVNTNDGNIYPVGVPSGTVGPAIATGGSRGDLVKVDDGYMYATQSDNVAKIGPQFFHDSCITIEKATDPAGGPGSLILADKPLTLSFGIFLNDGQSRTFCGLAPGSYNFSEIPAVGWSLRRIACIVNGSGSSTYSIATSSGFPTDVTINLQATNHVTCTFTNKAVDYAVGGVVNLPIADSGPGQAQATDPSSWTPLAAAIAGAVALVLGGWYVRRCSARS
jgi:hypothetical protein